MPSADQNEQEGSPPAVPDQAAISRRGMTHVAAFSPKPREVFTERGRALNWREAPLCAWFGRAHRKPPSTPHRGLDRGAKPVVAGPPRCGCCWCFSDSNTSLRGPNRSSRPPRTTASRSAEAIRLSRCAATMTNAPRVRRREDDVDENGLAFSVEVGIGLVEDVDAPGRRTSRGPVRSVAAGQTTDPFLERSQHFGVVATW